MSQLSRMVSSQLLELIGNLCFVSASSTRVKVAVCEAGRAEAASFPL